MIINSSSFFPATLIFLLMLPILPAYVVFLETQRGDIFFQSAYAQLSGVTAVVDETIRPSSIVLMNIEYLPIKEKAGDAESNPNSLQLVSQNVGEECCYKIQYTPGPIGKVGIAYKADKNYDLSDAKRVVFFAMGEQGGEKVSFFAAGKDAEAPMDIFKNKRFAAVTQEIVLEKDWRRYEMNVEGSELRGVTYPFAFIVNKGQDLGPVVFSLKGVTYDSKAAADPLTLQETTNETSFSNTTTPATTEPNSTNGNNNTTSTERLAIASQEFEGNGTASDDGSSDLGPNKLREDFKDSFNKNTSSARGELLVPQPSNQTALTNNNTANRTDINTTAAADNKTRPTSLPQENQMINNMSSLSSLSTLLPLPPLIPRTTTTFTSTIQPEPMNNNTITGNGNVDPITTIDNNIGNLTDPTKVALLSETATSSEASTIHNLDPHHLDANTFGYSIISNNSSSNISSPSLNDDDQSLSMATNEQYLYNSNQASYGKTGSQSLRPFVTPVLPYTLAPYEYRNYTQSSSSFYSPLTASNTGQQGEVDGADNGNAGLLENRNIAAPSTETTTTTLPQQYQVPPLTQQYQVPPLTTGDTAIQGEVDGADNGNAGAATTLQQLPGSTLVLPPSSSGSSPPETAITSAIDSSTGLDIQYGGSTSLSSSIIFSFIDTDDLDITGYVCSIDGLPVFACSSPVIIDRNILQATGISNGGNDFGHSFHVSTLDIAGNIDPTPAVFDWIAADTILPETIITPEGLPRETITPNTNVPNTILPDTIITPETVTPNTVVSEIPALEALTP